MKVSRRKPITDMRAESMAGEIVPRIDDLAKELGVKNWVVDAALWRFIQMATRVEFEAGEVDFELPLGSDDVETIAAKFVRFVGSECQEQIEAAHRAITELDKPHDPVSGPVPPKDDKPGE